ncbi:hypothetical protein BDV11DRAFT_182430 [Aspergillus similis]
MACSSRDFTKPQQQTDGFLPVASSRAKNTVEPCRLQCAVQGIRSKGPNVHSAIVTGTSPLNIPRPRRLYSIHHRHHLRPQKRQRVHSWAAH